MGFITTAQAAERWGISKRQVERLICTGRIAGVQRVGRSILIPEDTEKPVDRRRTPINSESRNLRKSFFRPCIPLRRSDLRPVVDFSGADVLAETQIAYMRGDLRAAPKLLRSVPESDENWITAAGMALWSAVDTGDVNLISQIRDRIAQGDDTGLSGPLLRSLPETAYSVCLGLTKRTPIWLKAYDFSLFDAELTPYLTYLYIVHLRNIGDVQGMLSASRMAARFCERADTFTWTDISFPTMAAVACYVLRDERSARVYLSRALELAILCGFVRPLADAASFLGGLLESMLEERSHDMLVKVQALWKVSFPNRIRIYNRESGSQFLDTLTQREYQLALLLARGYTYREAADALGVSEGRLGNLASALYGKMGISYRRELATKLWIPDGSYQRG